MARGIYIVNMTAVSVSAAITLIQVKAGTNNPVEIVKASCFQSGSTTSTMQRIQLLRKSAAATVTTFTPLLKYTGDAASAAVGGTTSTGTNASGEGTDGDILANEVFNILNGWVYYPVPDDRDFVKGGDIIGLKFPAAPGSALTVTAQVIFREL